MARQLRIAQHGKEFVVWCSKNLEDFLQNYFVLAVIKKDFESLE